MPRRPGVPSCGSSRCASGDSRTAPRSRYWADEHGDPNLEHIGLALANLGARGSVQTENANKGLSTNYTIGKQTKSAYEFLYNEPLPPAPPVGNPPPEQLPLKLGDDFKLPWTLYQGMYTDSQDIVRPFAETLTDGDKATAAFWPTIAQFGLPYNLLVLAKVDAARAPPAAGTARQGLGRPEDEHLAGEGAPVRDRHEHPGVAGAVHRARQVGALHARHGHGAQAGSDDQGTYADRDHRLDERRRAAARLHRERRRLALRAPGSEDVDHGVGHLARPRLSLAHRHGRDADDDVRQSSRRSPALRAAAAAVAVADRLRFRPAYVSVGPDLAPDAGAGVPGAPHAPRPLRGQPLVLRRRPPERARDARTRRQRLHGEDAVGHVSRRRLPARHLGHHLHLRDRGRRRHVHERRHTSRRTAG